MNMNTHMTTTMHIRTSMTTQTTTSTRTTMKTQNTSKTGWQEHPAIYSMSGSWSMKVRIAQMF